MQWCQKVQVQICKSVGVLLAVTVVKLGGSVCLSANGRGSWSMEIIIFFTMMVEVSAAGWHSVAGSQLWAPWGHFFFGWIFFRHAAKKLEEWCTEDVTNACRTRWGIPSGPGDLCGFFLGIYTYLLWLHLSRGPGPLVIFGSPFLMLIVRDCKHVFYIGQWMWWWCLGRTFFMMLWGLYYEPTMWAAMRSWVLCPIKNSIQFILG